MLKSDLRKEYKAKRQAFSQEEINDFNTLLLKKVTALDWQLYQNIHIFLSIEKHKEINTKPIISYLRSMDKTLIISKSNFKENTLSHFIYEENTVLETNSWGISEPINAVEFPVKEIDLVFVPMLISDEKNFRVGYGKGFYDGFLSACKEDVKTIGLNFFKPISKISDIHEADVALDVVLHP